ncbi:MAG: hypothetical protein IKL22_01715 [Lachnospiraceae bacterium]|nr:hypothetical protein [Lachnospiraceae bacterium]
MNVKRNYKDSIFRMLYLDKKELLSLYNAVNGTHYTDVDGLEINTLQNAIYMNMKNDVSFLFNFQVNLYEHQSTVNPNIPLRDLLYVSKLLQNIVKDSDLYGATLVKIPAPRFVVFYNGKEHQPERRVYKLSDAFSKKQDEPELELMVTVLNINAGNNAEILGSCKTLREYMQYTEKVRRYAMQMPIEQAVERTITECIKEDILAEFLKKNRAEAMEVSIFEYNEELHLANLRREGYEEGLADGIERGISQGITQGITQGVQDLLLDILGDIGIISEVLEAAIVEQTDIDVLNGWVKIAARCSKIEEFEEGLRRSL